MIEWDEHVADYLRLRRQLGFSLVRDEHLLGQFTAHLTAADVETITIAEAIAWAGLLPEGVTDRPATRASTRLTAIRGFAAYLHALDPSTRCPPRSVFSRHVPRPTPHIYTSSEVTALIAAAGRLNGGVRREPTRCCSGCSPRPGCASARPSRWTARGGLDGRSTDDQPGQQVPRSTPCPTPSDHDGRAGRYTAWRDKHEQRSRARSGNEAFFTDRDGDGLDYMNVRHAFVQASTGIRTVHGLTATADA